MIRYHLDDLGWYQFEWLVQSLLKAECGLAVESWGGSGDYGNDAYCSEKLSFPTQMPHMGPFVFQVKFVQDANAAGANSKDSIINAVNREIQKITKRMKMGLWKKPNYYILITNAPISAA